MESAAGYKGRRFTRINATVAAKLTASCTLGDTVALVQKLGGSIVSPKTAVPKTAWVTIVSDPAKNFFGVWQADPSAFPLPEPD
jgi:predicted enzyme related to lactoylglutathione lyase